MEVLPPRRLDPADRFAGGHGVGHEARGEDPVIADREGVQRVADEGEGRGKMVPVQDMSASYGL